MIPDTGYLDFGNLGFRIILGFRFPAPSTGIRSQSLYLDVWGMCGRFALALLESDFEVAVGSPS